MRYDWETLNWQEVSAFVEHFIKMELAMYGFETSTTEANNRGIDFVTRLKSGPLITIKARILREVGYTSVQKSEFPLSPQQFMAVVPLSQGKSPALYLIPEDTWRSPNALSLDRGFKENLSAPEWGLNLTEKQMPLLEPYVVDNMIEKLRR